MKLCECGCGQPAPLATQTRNNRGFKLGEPQKYIRGHSRIKNGTRKIDRERLSCSCGCGLLAPIDCHFVHGHNRRRSLSVLDSNGYEQTRLVPEEFSSMRDAGGYVLVHRLILAQWLGRPLLPEEQVHHKNQDRRDNRIINLEILTASEHAKLHHDLWPVQERRKEVVPK